jgi:tetratricopeptide (TPR) repeat protein
MADEMTEHATMMAKEMPMVEGITAASLLIRLRFGKWLDVIRAPMATAGPYSTAASHFARGVAFAELGNIAGAQSERRMFEEVRGKLTDDPGVTQNNPKDLAAVAANVLDARIAMASGDRTSAIAAYRKAVAVEDTLNYDEPPDWYYPVRESLGGALLRDGQAAEAEQVFRDDLARNPNNPRSLFGLAAALRAQKKSAASAEAEFKRMWKGGALVLE